MNTFKSKQIAVTFAAFGATAVMLTVIQVPFKAGYLAWVALVPFILICRPDVKTWPLVLISYVVSTCYWLGNLYWIGYVTVPAYILFCMYMGLYWPILVLCIQFCRSKKYLPLFLMVPVVFVGAEAWQGILITGFSWRLLAHSQYDNIVLIQISDIFGALGVSFLIAMINGFVAELLIEIRRKGFTILRTGNLARIDIVACLIIGAIIYGHWRIDQSDDFIKTGPLIGSVQPNVPSHVKEQAGAGEQILADLIDRTRACTDAGAELVAWPETMVLTSINTSYLELCAPDTKPRIFDEMISNTSKLKGYILVGAHTAEFDRKDLEFVLTDRFNSAFLYRPDGTQDQKRYDKIHLVPFGEYIPFKQTAPFIYKSILKFSPYDYDYNLTHGKEYTTFKMDSKNRTYRFGVLICYEDTDPRITKKMVVDDKGGKKVDWLVNISNDGWYVRYKNDTVLPSVELSQRTAISVFRAVENRISILRSVNTGISCIIDSVGRIQDNFVAGNLPDQAMARQGVAGWFVDRVQPDSRITFFSKHRQWLDFCCAAGLIVVIILGLRYKDTSTQRPKAKD